MTTYLVATLSVYVLVDAADATEARRKARRPLNEMLGDVCRRTGYTGEIPIQTVRPATDDEIKLWRWHQEMTAKETR